MLILNVVSASFGDMAESDFSGYNLKISLHFPRSMSVSTASVRLYPLTTPAIHAINLTVPFPSRSLTSLAALSSPDSSVISTSSTTVNLFSTSLLEVDSTSLDLRSEAADPDRCVRA